MTCLYTKPRSGTTRQKPAPFLAGSDASLERLVHVLDEVALLDPHLDALLDRQVDDLLELQVDALVEVHVDAPLEAQDVDALLAVQDVGAILEVQDVEAPLEAQDVGALLEVQDVGALLEVQDVDAPLEAQDVDALLEVQDVSAFVWCLWTRPGSSHFASGEPGRGRRPACSPWRLDRQQRPLSQTGYPRCDESVQHVGDRMNSCAEEDLGSGQGSPAEEARDVSAL